MEKQHFFILAILGFIWGGCNNNPVERNTIVFRNNTNHVQDSLIRMNELMRKLPGSNGCNISYEFNEDTIKINGCPGRTQDEIKADSSIAYSKFNRNEKSEFISLAHYLKRNYITAGYSYYNTKLWMYTYRELSDIDFHDSRDIAIIENADVAIVTQQSKILDRKGKIYLLSDKGAKIR
ncbi:hypothetical protein BDD43_2635 [Mucilaginibacter gracilis]|uniref:Uncharacterized protein n=1 Tax=Mucilaginibacter gracilis TaxID=423350 RepID=A0A495J0F2_9SPHI|nr:hypothetical protein [Mucilaginibacter gracilis]RKR82455.1 hypothetical protein BDD43_2635 [Mucilaginibacter gracilis]